MSVIDKIRKIVKEEIEEAMGKGSLVPGMYPDPTGSERRADRRKLRRRGRAAATEEPPEIEMPDEPDEPKEYDISALLADYDPYSEEASELPADVRKKIQDLRRKFSVSEPLGERSLTKPEKRKLKSLEKKTPKKSFKDQYGKEKGEEVYYATLTKRAKEEA